MPVACQCWTVGRRGKPVQRRTPEVYKRMPVACRHWMVECRRKPAQKKTPEAYKRRPAACRYWTEGCRQKPAQKRTPEVYKRRPVPCQCWTEGCRRTARWQRTAPDRKKAEHSCPGKRGRPAVPVWRRREWAEPYRACPPKAVWRGKMCWKKAQPQRYCWQVPKCWRLARCQKKKCLCQMPVQTLQAPAGKVCYPKVVVWKTPPPVLYHSWYKTDFPRQQWRRIWGRYVHCYSCFASFPAYLYGLYTTLNQLHQSYTICGGMSLPLCVEKYLFPMWLSVCLTARI